MQIAPKMVKELKIHALGGAGNRLGSPEAASTGRSNRDDASKHKIGLPCYSCSASATS
jgi:hypothetical protein